MNKNILKFLNGFATNKEFAIVLIVVFVLMMMIVPLATIIMDGIIALNIALTVLVLMVVIYMRTTISLTSFPSILLVLALLRIGITVSTSRLILLDGNAGEIVSTFGQFVVGGNMVVGIIIFVIITIINFIVITKGSERVAEVGARFSLDAMPGKQMSIDADLKAGNINMEQATEKRKNLGLESRLYGAMDGAMKFVKGDAIASIVDILINLVGGLIIGIAQRGMSFSDAVTTYSILTVGDGLVQQIPALLISLTAGMMITRVSDDDEDKNLGQNILGQVFNTHKPLFSSCILLIILALIPGMPSAVFGVIFIFFGIIGLFLFKKIKKNPATDGVKNAIVEDTDTENILPENIQLRVSPLILYVATQFKTNTLMTNFKNIITSIRQQVANEIGIAIPQIMLRYDSSYTETEYRLDVFEVPEVNGTIYWQHILILDTTCRELIDFNDVIDNQLSFGEQNLGFWVSTSYAKLCTENEIAFLTCEQFLLLHLKFHINRHIADFLGLQEVKNILDGFTEYQELIKELLRMLPLNKITEIFQRLVAERISIRNLKLILDTMLEWAQQERDVVAITEQIRKVLGRYIAHKFSNGNYLFSTIIFSSEVEDAIRDSIRYSENGSTLALDPRVANNIINSIKQILQANKNIKNPIIACQFDIRRYARSLVERELPFLNVLSFQEVEAHAKFHNLDVVTFN